MSDDHEATTEDAGEARPVEKPAAPPRTIGQLAGALAKAQGEFNNPDKNILVEIQNKQGTAVLYSYRYADLAAIWNVIREPLSKNGLAVIQTTVQRNADVFVRTVLAHESGEVVSQELFAGNVNQDIKILGGKITYVRRYCLSAMLGIASEDDADSDRRAPGDGEPMSAGGAQQQQQQQPRKADNRPVQSVNRRFPRGVLKVDLTQNKVVNEVDANNLDNDVLENALAHAKAREGHYAKLGKRWHSWVLDAQLDQKTIRLILDERAADDMPPVEDDGDGTPSTVDREPSTDTEPPPDDVPAGDTAPAKDDTPPPDDAVDGGSPSTVDGQQSTAPDDAERLQREAQATADETGLNVKQSNFFGGTASATPNVLVSERPARIDVEVPDELADQVATVTGLSTDELAALETLQPAEVVGMILHPANRKLFDPALGAEIAKFGDHPPLSGLWLAYCWLGCLETRKELKRDARKLARLAVVGLDLHERVGSKEPPEVITRRAAKEEQARVVALLANLSSPEAAKQRLSELS